MIDLKLWESRIAAINEFFLSYSFETKAPPIMILSFFGLFLVISAQLGFGFYIFYLKSSNDQTQSRLLNILNGYLSAACMTCSPAVFTLMMQLTIKKDLPGHELKEDEHVISNGRLTATHFIAVSVLFLFISFATVLNHFKPGLYLDISLKWRHWIAIPVMVICFILTEQTIHVYCHQEKNPYKCEVFILRTMVMMTATVTGFICQIIVVVDDIWGWKNIYKGRLQKKKRQKE